MHGHRAVLSPRRKARQPQKAGKRGTGVARAFTSAQPQLAGPFAEKEGQGSDATAAFLRQMHLPKAKKTPEQSGLCSGVARVFPVRHAHPAPSPAPRGAAAAKGRKARRRRRARVYKRAAAASGAFCGKGGARERGDSGFFAADAICQKQKRRRSKADFAPTWRAWQDSNLRPTGS